MQIPKLLFIDSSEITCYLVSKRSSYWRICLNLPVGTNDFTLLRKVRTSTKVHPTSYSDVTGVLHGVKVTERDSYHLTPPSAQVRHEWSCTSNPTTWVYDIQRQNFPIYTRLYQQGMRKTLKASGGITSVPFGIRTCYLPNRSPNHYCSLHAQ